MLFPRHRHYLIGMSGKIFLAPHHSTEELERRYRDFMLTHDTSDRFAPPTQRPVAAE